jgi:hypothetical protein
MAQTGNKHDAVAEFEARDLALQRAGVGIDHQDFGTV